MSENIIQQNIIKRHKERKPVLLKKDEKITLVSELGGIYIYNYSLQGKSDIRNLNFEYSTGAYYRLKIRREITKKSYRICDKDGGLKIHIDRKDGQGSVDVFFPMIFDLFELRNKLSDGKRLSLLTNAEESMLEEEDIKAEFYFKTSNKKYKRLEAVMDLDHPSAEIVFDRFLTTIDNCFEDLFNFGYKTAKQMRKDKFSKLVNIFKENHIDYNLKKKMGLFWI